MIKTASVGKAALQQHAKSKGHRTVADMRKNRSAGQIVFAAIDIENNEDLSSEAEESIEDTSEASRSTAPVHKKKTFGLMSLAAPPSLSSKNLSQEDQITAAETVLTLKAAESGWSFSSIENLSQVLAKADPKSSIWLKVKLGRHKHS